MHYSKLRPAKPGVIQPEGTVYLLHFDRPYHHAAHYCGWTENLEQRLDDHRWGRGSPLLHAAYKAGVRWTVARTWEGVTRETERRIKNRGSALRVCPICKANKKAAKIAA